jgi:hypothetical protein
MGLESATYIDDLVATNPVHTDVISQADSHIRLLKSVLQATFPNITGPVTATEAEINAGASSGADIIALQTDKLNNTTDTLTGDLTITGDVEADNAVLGGDLTAAGTIAAPTVAGVSVTATGALTGDSVVSASTVTGASFRSSGTGVVEQPFRSTQLGGATDQKTWTWGAQASDGSFAIRTADDAYTSFGTAFKASRGTTYTVGAIGLYTAGTERLRIDSTGRVGIGTVSPAYTLDVTGTMNVSGALTVGSFAITNMTVSGTLSVGTISQTGSLTTAANVNAVGMNASGNMVAAGYVQGAQIKAGASGVYFNDGTTQTTAAVTATPYTPSGTLGSTMNTVFPLGSGNAIWKSGTVTTDGGGAGTVSFGTAFPNGISAVILSMKNPSNSNTVVSYSSESVSGFSVSSYRPDTGAARASVTMSWYATGY